jgi:hypothetical protein
MKCGNCGQDILQVHPEMCPYCRSKNLISEEDAEQKTQEIEKLEKAGRYEDAALMYEQLDLWDKAKECRKTAKKKHIDTLRLEEGKIGTISIICPHCGSSQTVSKSGEQTCNHCGTIYLLPRKVLELSNFE